VAFSPFGWSDPDGDKVLGTSAFDVASLWQILPTVTLPSYVVVKKILQYCFHCIVVSGQSSKSSCLTLKKSQMY